MSFLSKKIKRNIRAISKLWHFVNIDILINLYYALIYPFFYLWHLAWGNTCSSTVNPLLLLQKKGLCVIAFSEYREHTSSLFANLDISKFCNLFISTMQSSCTITILEISQVLLTCFFTKVNQRHSYNTRLASQMSFSLPQVRTNYGKFIIRFTGVKVWI